MYVNNDGTFQNKLIETTVGRVIFNQHVPKGVGYINALLTKKALREIIGDIIKWTNIPATAKFLDDIKTTWVSVWHSRVVYHLILMTLSFPIRNRK